MHHVQHELYLNFPHSSLNSGSQWSDVVPNAVAWCARVDFGFNRSHCARWQQMWKTTKWSKTLVDCSYYIGCYGVTSKRNTWCTRISKGSGFSSAVFILLIDVDSFFTRSSPDPPVDKSTFVSNLRVLICEMWTTITKSACFCPLNFSHAVFFVRPLILKWKPKQSDSYWCSSVYTCVTNSECWLKGNVSNGAVVSLLLQANSLTSWYDKFSETNTLTVVNQQTWTHQSAVINAEIFLDACHTVQPSQARALWIALNGRVHRSQQRLKIICKRLWRAEKRAV